MTHMAERGKSYLRVCLTWRYGLALCVGLSLVLILYYHYTQALTVTLSHQPDTKGHHKMLVTGTNTTELSAAGLVRLWQDLRLEFVNSLHMLLAIAAGDTLLVKLIQRHMYPPSNSRYKLSFNYGPPPQTKVAREYFKSIGQSKGFFVECGGLDGERSSTTYHLERDGWQGLLIEADPDYFLQSLGKNRRAWKLNAALCPSAEPSIVSFKDSPNRGLGKLVPGGNHAVPCIPLALVMKALNTTRIDFFSLDVEGLELKILKTIPYKELDIRAITMEYSHNEARQSDISAFMTSVGYTLHKKIDKSDHSHRMYTNDLFYIKNQT